MIPGSLAGTGLLRTGSTAASGFYTHQIEQSLRFDNEAGDLLERTPSSASNRKTWTWSCWFKRGMLGNLGTDSVLFGADAGSGNYAQIRLNTSNSPIDGFSYFGNTNSTQINWTPLFQDTNAWYHFVLALDTTQSTNTNRVKFYANGNQITNTTYASWPNQDADMAINNTIAHQIGELQYASSTELDGLMAEVTFIDGTALDPSSFGETKAGVWIPKNTSSLTFGTNGFLLKFGNSGNFGLDSSGNGNNFTATNLGTDHQEIDSPTIGTG